MVYACKKLISIMRVLLYQAISSALMLLCRKDVTNTLGFDSSKVSLFPYGLIFKAKLTDHLTTLYLKSLSFSITKVSLWFLCDFITSKHLANNKPLNTAFFCFFQWYGIHIEYHYLKRQDLIDFEEKSQVMDCYQNTTTLK